MRVMSEASPRSENSCWTVVQLCSHHMFSSFPRVVISLRARPSTSKRDVLTLVPAQRVDELLRPHVGPQGGDDMDGRIRALNRQEAGQPAAAAPTYHQVYPARLAGAQPRS